MGWLLCGEYLSVFGVCCSCFVVVDIYVLLVVLYVYAVSG